MSRLFHNKKVTAFAVIGVLVVAGGAYAYWTTGGTGTGSATTGDAVAVSITQIGTVTDLVPGSTAQGVNFTITNSEATPQYVTSVSFAIDSIETAPGVAAVGCSVADFTLVQPTAINADQAPGDTDHNPSGATIAMNNLATNQDGCKDVTVNLEFTSV